MDGERVLLVSTKRGAPGYLVPPGGGLEAGESIAEAAVREVAEESGLAVEAGELVAYRELWQGGAMTLELYVAARPRLNQMPAAAVSSEGREVEWLTGDELARAPHFPEQLAELCRLAREPGRGAVYLGRTDL
jgi:ADP-ribose pyrophosphatase YjhB (NUDIX family)